MEGIFFLFAASGNAHNYATVHLDKAAIAIPGKLRILRDVGQAFHCLVIQTKVQDSVHHARHGISSTGTHRYQEGVGAAAEFLLELSLNTLHSVGDGLAQRCWIALLVIVVVGADLGADGKARRHRQAD